MSTLLLLLLCASPSSAPPSPWETLAPGVELAEFEASLKSQVGDSRVTVLRVDVARRPVRLLSVTRRAYGFRTFRATEIALYHALGKLPDPQDSATHRFC